MLKKTYIYAPGPVTVPPQVLQALSRPIIHHRAADFDPLFKNCNEGLQYAFQTKSPIVTFASSGTGALEAAVIGTASAGDHVISIEGGKFGERWGDIAKVWGFDVERLEVEWGTDLAPERLADALKKRPDTKAVYVTLCETSTATLFDVKALAEITRSTETVLIVDGVSGLGCDELRTDEWGVDMVGTGSQKALMLPPGLGFLSVNEKARKALEASKSPKFYFNVLKALKELEKNTTPFTPAVSLLFGLEAALELIKSEGLENVWKRHARLAEATRRAMRAINLEVYSQKPANTVTALKVPDGIEGGKITKGLRERHGVTIAGGQGHLKGKIFRIATLGYYNELDTLSIIEAVEDVLHTLGHKFDRGAGLTAAAQYFSSAPSS